MKTDLRLPLQDAASALPLRRPAGTAIANPSEYLYGVTFDLCKSDPVWSQWRVDMVQRWWLECMQR